MTTKKTTTNPKFTNLRVEYEHGQEGVKKALADHLQNNGQWADFMQNLSVYDYSTYCVSKAVENLIITTGVEFFEQLERGKHQDRTASRLQHICQEITKHQHRKAEYDKAINHYNSISKLIKSTAEERKSAHTAKQRYQKLSKQEQDRIDTLAKKISTTYTERENLVEDAVEQYLNNIITPAEITDTIIQSYAPDGQEDTFTIDDLTEEQKEQAQTRANYKKVMAHIKNSIRGLSHPDAMNDTKTVVKKIDRTAVNEFIRLRGGIGEEYPEKTKGGYITIEHRNDKKYQGYYKVYHYKTVAQYQYITDYTDSEDGETDAAYLKTYNPYINCFADYEILSDMCQDLTAQEMKVLNHFIKYIEKGLDKRTARKQAYNDFGVTAESTIYRRWAKIEQVITNRAIALHIIK